MQDPSSARPRSRVAAMASLCAFGSPFLCAPADIASAAEQPAGAAAPRAPAPPAPPASPGGARPRPSQTAKPAPLPPDIAIVATKEALVRFDATDKTTQELTREPVAWCAVDNRAQVLWYLRKEPATASPQGAPPDASLLSLKFLDLRENRAPVTVVPATRVRSDAFPALVPLIDHGDETLGAELQPFGPAIFLHLKLHARPELAVSLSCEGDASWYCFKMDGAPLRTDASGETEWPVKDEIAVALADLKKMPLLQTDALLGLRQRAGNRKLWQAGTERTMPRVGSVPAKGCDPELDSCGSATSIPGTPFWSVVVATSRGDYAHETRQFYDPARKRFFDPRQKGRASPKPLAGGPALASMFISPSGRSLLMDQEVISFEHGTLYRAEQICGWLGAGWRYTHTHP